MGALNNLYVSSSFQGLLKMTNSATGLTSTLQTVEAGDGSDSPLQMSLTAINISGSFTVNNLPITGSTSGTSGTSGSSGTAGSSGSSGTAGTSGSSGSSGTSGVNGSSGSSGTSGINGSSGTSGFNGSSGSSGTAGSSGTSGSSGVSGSSGTSGGTGSSGTSGTSGSSGSDGLVGSNGTSGTSGVDGSSGTSGSSGVSPSLVGLITTGSISDIQSITGSLNVSGSESVIGTLNLKRPGNTTVENVTSSLLNGGNILLDGPANLTTSASFFISGSNNIAITQFPNTVATNRNIVNGNGNIIPAGQIQLNTSSLMVPGTFANYINGGSINCTFTTSSLVGGVPGFSNNILNGGIFNANLPSGSMTVSNNNINSQVTHTATGTTLTIRPVFSNNLVMNNTIINHISSSINSNGTIYQGLNNRIDNTYFHTGSNNNVLFNRNIVAGTTNTINFGGNPPANISRTASDNIVGGNNNIVSLQATGSIGALYSTLVFGNNLIASGSNTGASAGGSAFVGRYNAIGNLQDSSQDAVFVVGTGTSPGNRRNSLHIDQAGNTRLTGSVQISGSLQVNGQNVFTGSVDRNGLITTGSAFSDQTIEGTLRVSGSANQAFQILSGENTAKIDILNGGHAFYRNSNTYNTVIGNAAGIDNGFTGSNNLLFTGFFLGFTSGSFNSVVSGNGGANFRSGSANAILGQVGALEFGNNNTYINAGSPNTLEDSTLRIGAGGNSILIKSGSAPLQINSNTEITGSLEVTSDLVIASGSGTNDLFMYGHKMFNVGSFYSTQIQSGSANVSQSITFNTTDISEGVSVVAGSQLTLANAGIYNIQFSAQLLADTGADDVWIWLKKNGTNVSDSAGLQILNNNQEAVVSWNYVVNAAANDYFELAWQSLNGDAVLLYNASSGNIPAVPSVITTVTQVR